MSGRQWGALLLIGLTACASSPRGPASSAYPEQAERAALRYELHVLTAGAVDTRPVRVEREEFMQALRHPALAVRASEQPRHTARWLLEAALEAELLAEVEHERVVRLVPREDGSPLSTASNARLLAGYQRLCEQRYGGGDCLGLTEDGPVLDREDRRTLALAFALGGVLEETRQSLKHMVSPQAVLTLVLSAAVLYFMLWLVPEPLTKGVAALISLGLLAWLGAQTLWELVEGWGRLVHAADRATTLEELEQAGRSYSTGAGGEHRAGAGAGGDGGGGGGRREVLAAAVTVAGLQPSGGAGRGARRQAGSGWRGGGGGGSGPGHLHLDGTQPRPPGDGGG